MHGRRWREGLDELKNLIVVLLLVAVVGYFAWRQIPPAERPSLQDPSGVSGSVTVLPTPSPAGTTAG